MNVLKNTLLEIKGQLTERRRVRDLLARKIWETRQECQSDYIVPPESMLERIEVLREIGRELKV